MESYIKNCDCLDGMKELADNSVDLICTDPPYGVGMDRGFHGSSGFNGRGKQITRKKYPDKWDKERPSTEYFTEILRISKAAIIFGGNYFADILPQGKHWIVWDKLNTMPTFGDCELIWTNIPRNSVKKITVEYNGLIGKEKERFHPTQKPKKLMVKILKLYSREGNIICDPFCGSGTTALACLEMKRRYICFEKEQKYYDIAQQRIKEYKDQLKLF